MADFPPYSAYVPVYNQVATLPDALEGVRAQTIPPAEILVIDDGSTDGSAEIAEAAGATVIRLGRNAGRGTARARAIVAAKHEYILACDAGAKLHPDFAEKALARFRQEPRLGSVQGWFVQNRTGGVVNRWRSRHLFASPSPTLQRDATHITAGCMVRRSAVLAAGNYQTLLRAGEDAELGPRLKALRWQVWHDPELGFECLTEDKLAKVFERYARWNEGDAIPAQAATGRNWLRRLAYAVKVLAKRDLAEGDPVGVLISLALPNYLAWRAWKRRKDSPPLAMRPPVVHYVNTYAEPWLHACWNGEAVSRAHLWGADALVEAGFAVQPVYSQASRPLRRFARWLARICGGRLGDLGADVALLQQARGDELVYVAAGRLLLAPWLVRMGWSKLRIVSWLYKPVAPFSPRSLRGLPNARAVMEGYCGWLALTPLVEKWLRENYPPARTRRIVWAADTDYYPVAPGPGEYFLATGVTQRDFTVLLEAARKVNFPFVILGPEEFKARASSNVTWQVRNPAQPHTTIDDDRLRELYAHARAILIPLLPDPTDASGYTNLLEAIAMGRPVVMTRTGALDVTPGALGVGYDVKPGDAQGWVEALNHLAEELETSARFRARAVQLAREYFNLPRFERELGQYFLDLLHNRPEGRPQDIVARLSETKNGAFTPSTSR